MCERGLDEATLAAPERAFARCEPRPEGGPHLGIARPFWIVRRVPYENVVNVIRVGEDMRDERAKTETDHVAIGAPILDEERDLPAALEIKRAPQ